MKYDNNANYKSFQVTLFMGNDQYTNKYSILILPYIDSIQADPTFAPFLVGSMKRADRMKVSIVTPEMGIYRKDISLSGSKVHLDKVCP